MSEQDQTDQMVKGEAQDRVNKRLSDFLSKIRAKGARDSCPICDNKDWSVFMGVAGYAPSLPFLRFKSLDVPTDSADDRHHLLELAQPDVPGAFPLIVFTCKSCGFVRQHLEHFEKPYVINEQNAVGDGHHKYEPE